jgi:hypothetical protein
MQIKKRLQDYSAKAELIFFITRVGALLQKEI